MIRPTKDNYDELQNAYSHFNRLLFARLLPDCLITMQRRARTYGYFCQQRFVNEAGETADEIALNPSYFVTRGVEGVLSTLVHEMAHLWQSHFGHAGRRGYHNRQWADEMIKLGLYPTSTGLPGGSETGYHMTHYVVEGGVFDTACSELLSTGYRLTWMEHQALDFDRSPRRAPAVRGADGSNRWKYSCPACGLNAWAKPEISLLCGNCRVPMPRRVKAIAS